MNPRFEAADEASIVKHGTKSKSSEIMSDALFSSAPAFRAICSVCKGMKWQMDSEENMTCMICGTVTHEFLSQTNDINDGAGGLAGAQRSQRVQVCCGFGAS